MWEIDCFENYNKFFIYFFNFMDFVVYEILIIRDEDCGDLFSVYNLLYK